MAKSLSKTHTQLKLDQLLYDVHQFLVAHPPPVWTTYASDTPFRTVKTILHRVVELRGMETLDHLTLIPDSMDSYTYHYLAKSLKISPAVRVIKSGHKLPDKSVSVSVIQPHVEVQNPESEGAQQVETLHQELTVGSRNGDVAVGNGETDSAPAVSAVEESSTLTVVNHERMDRLPAVGSPLQQRRRDNLTPRANQKLGEIFTKIGSKENTVEVIRVCSQIDQEGVRLEIDWTGIA